ncbi:pyroglutamyl-peptidase I [Antribacter gilvus]|uniref:pyroglutamyl-peptidase I n=1 Tax=Antribacter gilvus TaxID=2304675 RepID=UPI000F7B0952|nr:pyroglutamyl-peptidase I [Antribacter gilvus]
MRPTVLVTGFEPFGGDPVNSSWEAVRLLAELWDADVEGADLATAVLPVTFGDAPTALATAVAEARPSVVVAVGLAGGAADVRLERVAINVADARIPDNGGAQPVDEPLDPQGPAAAFTGLPVKAALAALREAGIPAVVSNTAGTYVCNATFYALMRAAEGADGVLAGFVHVPRTAEEEADAAAALPVATLAEALRIVVRTTLDVSAGRLTEPALAAGAEH